MKFIVFRKLPIIFARVIFVFCKSFHIQLKTYVSKHMSGSWPTSSDIFSSSLFLHLQKNVCKFHRKAQNSLSETALSFQSMIVSMSNAGLEEPSSCRATSLSPLIVLTTSCYHSFILFYYAFHLYLYNGFLVETL